ncbi:hypothetical protein SAMN06298212_10565 [Ruaniaceae bacterium KH17]|nr:hypothetical protein SAMN06298212_10565 [Ruaniaceae bacterium KH17]
MARMTAPWGITIDAPDLAVADLTRAGWTPEGDADESHIVPAENVGEVGGEVTDGDETEAEAIERPKRQHSRGDWAHYAESLGLNVDGLKRDEIIELVNANITD